MKPLDIGLLLADVDGTLVTHDKVLTDDAREAVRELREAGIMFAITSGRPPRGMAMLIEPLAIDTPIAGFNGGVFVKPDLAPIEQRTLDPDAARSTLKLILDEGLDAWLYTPEDWFVRDPEAAHVAREAWTVKFEAKVTPEFTREQLDNTVKIVAVSDDHEKVAAAEKKARELLRDRASATRSQPYYLDVTNPQANKGAVVGALSRMLGVTPERIATIGDMPNDMLMFRASGYSIAMGQASDEVKRAAAAVTSSSEEEGFARGVRQFILRRA